MSTLTSKISDLNKKLAGVEDEIILSQSRADEYSSQILKLQKQLEIANDVVLEIKLKKRQILDEISSLISSEQAETPIESNIFNNPIEYLGLNLVFTCLSFIGYSTSGANEIIFIYPLSRSSRATGPKIRVPRGSSAAFRITTALSSKLM